MANKYEKSRAFCEMHAPLIRSLILKTKTKTKQPKNQPDLSVLQSAHSLLPWPQITIVTLDKSVFLD